MAVTLSVTAFIADARIGATAEELDLATRRLAYATEAVLKHAPNAPDVIHDEAVSRLAGYLYDQPTLSGGPAFANAMRNSGAGTILLPYRVHGLGYADTVEETNQAVGSVGNPVTGLSILADVLTVTFADGTTQELTLPAGSGGMFNGVDQTARNNAAQALTTANAAQVDAAAAQTTADGNTATIAALPAVPDVPPVYTTGNNDIIPKAKITNAAPNEYLVISNSGNITGVTGTPGGGGGGGTGELETITRNRDARQTFNTTATVTVADLTITADNFATGEKWLILYHVNFSFGGSGSDTYAATATLKHGSGELDTSFVEDDISSGPGVTGGTASGAAILNLIGTPEDITVEVGWSGATNFRRIEAGTGLIAVKVSGIGGGIDDAAVQVLIDAHAADPNIHHLQGGTGLLNVVEGRLPAAPVAMRIAWSLPNAAITAATFGADSAQGSSDETVSPDYPQAFRDAGHDSAILVFWAATDSEPAELPLDTGDVGATSTALQIAGVDGNYWTTVDPVSRFFAGIPFSILFPGVVIASQPWVTEQIEAIPAPAGGGGVTKVGTWAAADTAANTWTSTGLTPSATATLIGVQFIDGTYTAGGLTDVDDWVVSWLDAERLRDGNSARVNVRPVNVSRVYAIDLSGGAVRIRGHAVAAGESLKVVVWTQ